MKVYYRICSECNECRPYLTYFLSKEENKKLTEEERKLCEECYKDKKFWEKKFPKNNL
jgi:hypothetical protein